jgi:Raf kinase inhibitor-like YbhB/YbcL family protein
MASLRLTSPAFAHDDPLPDAYATDGDALSPPLAWSGAPQGTKEYVLICDDPDAEAGVFTHWVVYGIAADVSELPEGIPDDAILEEPVPLVQGLNEYDEVGYQGPEFDEDRGPHRLFFRLFALDTELDLPPGVTRADLRRATKGHILANSELVAII